MGASVWAAIGLVLLAVELVTTHFVMLFFGLSALIIAGIKIFFPESNLINEVSTWAALGAVLAFALRKPILKRWSPEGSINIDKNKIITLTSEIKSQEEGQVTYQGTVWTAVNDSPKDFKVGDKAQIVITKGNILILQLIKEK